MDCTIASASLLRTSARRVAFAKGRSPGYQSLPAGGPKSYRSGSTPFRELVPVGRLKGCGLVRYENVKKRSRLRARKARR